MSETLHHGDECHIRSEADLVAVRAMLRNRGVAVGLGMVDLTKFITAGSELARNILKYAGGKGGKLLVEVVGDNRRKGVRAVFDDQGPGIENIELALVDGYSTGSSMGLGLPGAKRLSDEFHIESAPGRGTRVVIVRWKR